MSEAVQKTPATPPARKKARRARPKRIAGFELVSKIGSGAMGAVFKARQLSLDRIVALKVLPPKIAQKDPAFVERFIREARCSAALNHAHIVQGIEVGQDPATKLYFFAMEFIDGPTVKEVISREGVLDEDRALAIVRGVAEALRCAHKAGIVHRDIKPDNILLTAKGEAKLADLGLAKRIGHAESTAAGDDSDTAHEAQDAGLTVVGKALGTPYYMAPEQVLGQLDRIDIRTDLYALGATFYHMLTGQPPFTGGSSKDIMRMRLEAPIPNARKVNADVSEDTARVITRLMHIKPGIRFQTPGDLLTEIERIQRARQPGPDKGNTTRNLTPARRQAAVKAKGPRRAAAAKSWMPYAAAGVALAVLFFAGRSLLRPSAPSRDEARAARQTPNEALGVVDEAAASNPEKEKVEAPSDPAKKVTSDQATARATENVSASTPAGAANEVIAEPEAPLDARAPEEAPPATREERAARVWVPALERLDVPAARAALEIFFKKDGDPAPDELERNLLRGKLDAAVRARADGLSREVEAALAGDQLERATELLAGVRWGDEADASVELIAARTRIDLARKKLALAGAKQTPTDDGTTRQDNNEESAAPTARERRQLEKTRADVRALLKSGLVDAARKVLARAVERDDLAAVRAELQRDLDALRWLDDLEKQVAAGAAKLAGGEPFTLRLAKGEALAVGEGTERKVKGVSQGKLLVETTIGSMSATQRIDLSDLTRETRHELALFAAGPDMQAKGRMRVKTAFADILALLDDQDGERPKRELIVLQLAEAKAEGAPAEMVDTARAWMKHAR